jgi:multidrug resistance efflux pump
VPPELRPGRRSRARAILLAAWGLAAVGAVALHAGSGSVDVLVDAGVCEVVAPEDGVVAEVRVAAGGAAGADSVLLRMEDTDARLSLSLAQAGAERAALERVARRVDLEGDRAVAVGRLAAESEQAVSALADARGEVERVRLELADVEAQLASRRAWQADGIVAVAADDPLRARRVSLLARSGQVTTLLDAARRRAGAAAARLAAFDVAYLRGPDAARSLGASLAPLEAAAAEERVAVQRAEARLARLSVRAPCAGVVDAVHVVPGAWVAGGAVVAAVAQESVRSATAWRDEADARDWPLGARVALYGGILGETRAARVIGQSPRVTEMPERLRRDAATPRYGRPVFLALEAPASAGGARLTARVPYGAWSAP